jgi:hypothetical protein
MADKYVKGAGEYHLVEEGEKVTKCGWKVPRLAKLEEAKELGDWPTHDTCAAGGLPAEVKAKQPKK